MKGLGSNQLVGWGGALLVKFCSADHVCSRTLSWHIVYNRSLHQNHVLPLRGVQTCPEQDNAMSTQGTYT